MIRWFSIFFKLSGLTFLVLLSLSSIFATFSGAPWVPTRRKDFIRLKRALQLQKDDILYELGGGDGRVSIYLARNTSVKKIVAIELSFFYYLLACLRVFSEGLWGRVVVVWGDFFARDIHEATKVYLYLTSKTSNRLSQKFLNELRQGARVVTYRYPLEMWQHTEKDQPHRENTPLYVYTIHKGIQKLVLVL